MRLVLISSLVALVSFVAGVFASSFFEVEIRADLPITATTEALSTIQEDKHESPTQTTAYTFPEDNCGDDSDYVNIRPIIRKWLRGDKLKEVPYCSRTAKEATGFNQSNVIPKLVDLNNDGTQELAIRYLCSPTGNSAFDIYKQNGTKSYRQIFAGRNLVQTFEKSGNSHFAYSDIRTRDHGGCCDGGQVVYRYNGKQYHPISCAEYSYWDAMNAGQPAPKPTIKPVRCSRVLYF